MANFFINRPIFAIVLSIVITLVGLISAVNLPIAQYPQITPPQINVYATYNGANAKVIEQAVAQQIELQVNGVENMVSMQSNNTDTGNYQLNVKFELGKDADLAAVQTQSRVAQANAMLPPAVLQAGITVRKVSPDNALIFGLWSPKGTYDSIFLKNFGDITLIEDLKRVKGVGNINVYGADFGMRVWLKPDKMARLGLTVDDISSVLGEQNVQAPSGSIGQRPSPATQEFQYSATVKGRLIEPEEFRNIIVRSQRDGSFIRLRDVAEVELGGRNYMFASDINGQPAATFAIQLTTDANALETITACKKLLEDASKRFPPDMDYRIIVDNTLFVRESIKEVATTLVEAMLLVLLVVFIFLQSARATMIPMLAVPVSLIGTFTAFLVLGFSINTLTLFAMVLAVGLVVDDAIVVIEAVEHHMRYNNLSPRDATIKAMSEVSAPVIAIAFVLVSVFLPVAFFGGTVGVLYKQFALTVAVAVVLSAVVALSLTPALCALLLKPYNPEEHTGRLGRFFDKFNHWFENMVEKYGRGVMMSIKRAVRVMCLLGLLLVACGGLFVSLPTSFVPPEDQGFYLNAFNLPEASSMNRTQKVGNIIGKQVREQPGVQEVAVITGFDFLAIANKPSAGIIFVRLNPWADRKDYDLQIESQIRKTMAIGRTIPEATLLSFPAASLPGIGSRGGFSLMVQDRAGRTDAEIDDISKKFLAAARQRKEIGLVYSNFRIDTPGYQLEVDREKVKTLGIPLQNVFNALQVFLGGLEVGDFNRFGRTYKVVMQAEPQFRNDELSTRYLFVRSSSGTMVPLNTLVTPVPTSGPSVIQRFNGFRTIQIGGSPASGYSSSQALNAMEEVAAQVLPENWSYEWTDQSREEKISGGRAPILFAMSILFVFLVLAALYESWSIPFTIILSIPTGIFGAFLFQWLRHGYEMMRYSASGLENNIYMQIGLVMLIGLAAKNAILIIEFAKIRVERGMDPIKAVIEAATIRLRPILMTSLAFIIGCMPLVLSSGAGAGARKAMGTAVVGGMVMATSLGIFLIPVLYIVIIRLVERLKKWRTPAA